MFLNKHDFSLGQCHVRGVGAGAGTGGGGAGAKSAPEKELKKLKDEKKLEKNWSPLPVCTLHKFWLLSVTIKKINPIKKRFLGCLIIPSLWALFRCCNVVL